MTGKQEADTVPDVVKAKRFEVVEANGAMRAVPSPFQAGGSDLALSDSYGRPRASVGGCAACGTCSSNSRQQEAVQDEAATTAAVAEAD